MKNQKTTAEEILKFLQFFAHFAFAAEFIRHYLMLVEALKSEGDNSEYIKFVKVTYNNVLREFKIMNANHTYDEDVKYIRIPELLVIWETEDIGRRINKRHECKDIVVDKCENWISWTMKQANDMYLKKTIMYFEELDADFYINNSEKDKEYFTKHEGKYMFFQQMWLNMYKKQLNPRFCNWSQMNQMFRGAFEELISIPIKVNTKRIWNFNHYLRQSKGFADNELDTIDNIDSFQSTKEALTQTI